MAVSGVTVGVRVGVSVAVGGVTTSTGAAVGSGAGVEGDWVGTSVGGPAVNGGFDEESPPSPFHEKAIVPATSARIKKAAAVPPYFRSLP